ncbi:MAG: sugar phosphate isomerase/epimerase [Kiritimatiellaeota bacterium]|nr:sugar phosphate isomerase/epimerase [Kiritimatiellota bacterium]
MSNIISCRVQVFGSAEEALRRFPEAGIRFAEVPPPPDGDYAALARKAADAGVTLATLATQFHLESDEAAAKLDPVIVGAGEIGVPKIFVSAQAPTETPWEDAVRRMCRTAEFAARHGVVICMETHPRFGTNAEVARKTLEAVDHPSFRYNFDTANIYYYNEDADTPTELEKVVDLVGSVHLKDTDGGYRSGNFPVLGQGVVDFPAVFRILGRAGFTGPYTMEIEGGRVQGLSPDQRLDFLKQCVAYLQGIGVMP